MPALLDTLWPHLVMFASAFLAATILPFSSEAVLAAQLKAGLASPALLLTSATIGNVGGSAFNWWIGRFARQLQSRRWFPFTQDSIDRASARFQRYGAWSLLFAWLPVVGDPLTFIAGVLRVPLAVFLPLVTIGKLGRYLMIAWLL